MAAAGPLANAILLFATGPEAQALASALERGGNRIAVATSEEEALQALEDADFDLVLVHLPVPDPERLDVVKLMRMSDPSAGSPPVIVLADAMTAEVEQACADAGLDLRLVNPVDPRHLLDYVGDLLARSRFD
ncbi:MAG: response regulator [Rhodospirillales bacterium]